MRDEVQLQNDLFFNQKIRFEAPIQQPPFVRNPHGRLMSESQPGLSEFDLHRVVIRCLEQSRPELFMDRDRASDNCICERVILGAVTCF